MSDTDMILRAVADLKSDMKSEFRKHSERLEHIEQRLFRGNGRPSISEELTGHSEKIKILEKRAEKLESKPRHSIPAPPGIKSKTFWGSVVVAIITAIAGVVSAYVQAR